MNKLKDLKERLNTILWFTKETKLTYDYEEEYNNIYNLVTTYMNETQDFDLEYLFYDYIDYDTAEELTKQQIQEGGLERLQYFLGNTHFYDRNLFKINGYGNLSNVDKLDLEVLLEDLIDEIDRKLGEE